MRVAKDVGKTFTDKVLFDDAMPGSHGVIRGSKAGQMPPDFEAGVPNVVRKAGGEASGFDRLGIHQTKIDIRDRLATGNALAGPAAVDQPATTGVKPPVRQLRVDSLGNLGGTRANLG